MKNICNVCGKKAEEISTWSVEVKGYKIETGEMESKVTMDICYSCQSNKTYIEIGKLILNKTCDCQGYEKHKQEDNNG